MGHRVRVRALRAALASLDDMNRHTRVLIQEVEGRMAWKRFF
jgi:hypothetical protein